MSITISSELGRKGNFLVGGGKFCVGLWVDPLMPFLCKCLNNVYLQHI